MLCDLIYHRCRPKSSCAKERSEGWDPHAGERGKRIRLFFVFSGKEWVERVGRLEEGKKGEKKEKKKKLVDRTGGIE